MELSTQSRNSQAVSRGDWLAFGVWWILLIFGYFYVAGVLCQRDNPFRSGNPGFRDFVLVALVGPLLFFAGPRHNWKPARFSVRDIFRWNGLCYLLPFFLALHWEYLGDAIGAQFSLKPADLHSLDSRATTVLAVAVCIVITLLTFHLVWAHRAAILYPYITFLCGIPCLIWAITIVLGDSHYLHVHHYCLGAFLFPFFRFRNFLSLVAQATFLGLAVEGISRWGMDPMWYSAVAR
ncbi:hypothetical protein CA13_08740 [Planctomycetes bacterium CA13]|uniref:Uncharacterized protein n=1 Tax=Novipirellula herctigrandis TaxID=2527986 RepID=A0A5C5YYA9_9BACT|nr:hypothetical protein CA13_08740 [Planctomycetes bacterium CA13]